ncbi:MAG: 50S ribosomal protein L29 [Legionellaceae bacterium]|nr:50S ribosomal protein L29 [Legionellaceae bacterium]
MKSTAELRAMSQSDLLEELLGLRKEQFKMRMQKANDMLEKTHKVTMVRRAIARIKTIMTEISE